MHVLLLLFSSFLGVTISNCKILIPFAENHDSLFSYQLSTKNYSSSLETSGNIIIQKQENKIKFNFIDCFVNHSANLFLQPLIKRINTQPILYLDESDNFKSKNESVTWDIDPLFVTDVFRLSSFPAEYSVDDELQGLGESEGECVFQVRKVNETEKEVRVQFFMSLKDCQNRLFDVGTEDDQVKDGFVEVFWCFDKVNVDVLTTMEFIIQLASDTNFIICSGVVDFVKFLKKSVE